MVYIDDRIGELNLEEALDRVSSQRREKALRFRHEAGRRQAVAAYLLLQRALEQEYGITELPVFGFEEKGKPFLLDHPEIHFSLSHCKLAVACAVSDRPIGIDIEVIRPYNPTLAAYVLNEEDLRQVEEAERPEVEFTRRWTQKESFLKLTGEGISNKLKELDMTGVQRETTVNLEGGYVWTVSRFE